MEPVFDLNNNNIVESPVCRGGTYLKVLIKLIILVQTVHLLARIISSKYLFPLEEWARHVAAAFWVFLIGIPTLHSFIFHYAMYTL
jgi:hypothetical protein